MTDSNDPNAGNHPSDDGFQGSDGGDAYDDDVAPGAPFSATTT